MTLTEFLLARIVEDEDRANRLVATPNRFLPECDPLRLWPGDSVRLTAHGNNLQITPHRVLAECEAKRRIVERHAQPMILFGGVENWAWELKALSLPYADHPDYQQEWSA